MTKPLPTGQTELILTPLDSVIEFVDSNGVVLNTCVAPEFNSPCISDDMVEGVELDSLLEIRISAGLTVSYVTPAAVSRRRTD